MVRPFAALCAFLSGCLAFAAQAAPAQPPQARDDLWPQSYSDLPADPSVRFGTLANGVRYAIMRNDTPTGQTALRLRIGAGSLDESADQQGLAHVLEHMAFKGSRHAPNGEMVKLLEARGLSFGGDTNARTEETETVYQLDLPQSDEASLKLGLDFLRDIADGLTISPAALAPERGVVLSEERLRDTPDYEVYKARLAFQLKGQLAADRLPIGLTQVIEHAPASLVRAFYEAHYRPQDTVVVAVGDFDPDAMQARIARLFGDWRPATPSPAPPDLGRPEARGRAFQLIVRKGVAPSLAVAWALPHDDTPDSVAKQRRDDIEAVALAVLNRRLERLAHGDDPPFLAASAARGDIEDSARLATLQVLFRPGGWRRALDAAILTQRQALTYGLSQAEIDREVTDFGVSLRTAAAGAGTRRSPTLADEIVRSVGDDAVDTSPAEDLTLFTRFTAHLTAAEVTQALREAFQGSGPLVSLATPEAIDGGEGALAAAFAHAADTPVAAPAPVKAAVWRHTRFGPAGAVVQTRQVGDLGVTFVRFANGVRLTVKPTAFRKDEIQVAVNFGRGRLGEPRDRLVPDWALSAFIGGGVNDLGYEDLKQALSGRSVSVGLSLDDDAWRLAGATRPQDLDTELQLLAAYMSAPGWRPEAFARTQALMALTLQRLPATPEGVEARDLTGLLHSGDARWDSPDLAEVQDATLGGLKALLAPELSGGPLEVVITGDTSVQAAVAAVAKTFGALPPRAALPLPAGADCVAFPSGGGAPVVRLHQGRPDQAIAYLAWPATDLLSDPERARRINIAAAVMQLRLLDKVRIAEGASYSPAAGATESDTFPGYGYVSANVEIPPAKVDGFWSDTKAIAADLAAHEVGADELRRAVQPRIEGIEKSQQTNGYWTLMLHDADRDPRRLELIRTSPAGYRSITAADVRDAAQAYLDPARAWRFEIAPPHPAAASGPALAVPAPKTPLVAHTPPLSGPGAPPPAAPPVAAPPTASAPQGASR